MADIDGFEWVTTEQESHLAVTWGESWPEFLRATLDEHWPAWVEAGDEEKSAWLDDLIPSITADAFDEALDVADLAWVTPEQQAQLEEVAGDWPDWLVNELDELWPEWRSSSPEQLVPFLDEWISTITAGRLAEEGGANLDVAELAWVTEEQQAQLDAIGSDWTDWLAQELDSQWPEWRESTPETLETWLNDVIQSLTPADG